jgi:3-hydroxyacyl-CoA dehydrogenase
MSDQASVVKSERAGAVCVLTLDNPPVNAMSHALRAALKAGLDAALADPAVAAIVIIGAGRSFIAGADIGEFGKPRAAPLTPALITTIEQATKPVVAAIHGNALGGGLELAMACHLRLASPQTRFGQPEVKIGLIPGAGGTQRLPRLVGLELALEMITGGEPIGAEPALAAGLIDEIVPGDLRAGAITAALRAAETGKLRRARDIAAPPAPDPEYFTRYRAELAKRKRGLIAPDYGARAVTATSLTFEEGLAFEQALFAELVASDQSKALRYFFFAERDATKIPDVPAETASRDIRSAAVIGAGTMGGGIAMCFANVGLPVILVEANEEALARGLGAVRRNYETSARRGGISSADIERRMALIKGVTGYDAVADADLVIEAVFEDMALKKEIFTALDRIAKPDAILATNTSYLDTNAIAAATGRPESVVGLHFFSPANVMRLVEVVRGTRTQPGTIASAMAIARKIRKVPVLVGVCDGFVGNRMLGRRGREAERLLLEGASPQQVDQALTEFGLPMGPFAMGDMAGLDISFRGRKQRGQVWPIADAIVEAGRLGQKTGAGWYRYETGSRTPLPDPVTDHIIEEVAKRVGVERRPVDQDEILARLLYPMINEGARILEEGIALRASDIDVVWVYGYGWPAHRGGPMFYADQIGLATIRDRLAEFARRFHEPALEPAPLLQRLADDDGSFTAAAR